MNPASAGVQGVADNWPHRHAQERFDGPAL
jgi:hypothetical protein